MILIQLPFFQSQDNIHYDRGHHDRRDRDRHGHRDHGRGHDRGRHDRDCDREVLNIIKKGQNLTVRGLVVRGPSFSEP